MNQQSTAYFKHTLCVIHQKLNLNGYINARITSQALVKFRQATYCCVLKKCAPVLNNFRFRLSPEVDTAHV